MFYEFESLQQELIFIAVASLIVIIASVWDYRQKRIERERYRRE